jgi:hypothetical protein
MMTIIINILFQSTSMVSSHLVVKSSDYDVAGASLAPDGSGKKMEYGGEKVVAHIIALRASVRMAVTANPGTLAAFAQSRGCRYVNRGHKTYGEPLPLNDVRKSVGGLY